MAQHLSQPIPTRDVVLHVQDAPQLWSQSIVDTVLSGKIPSYRDLRYINDFRILLGSWIHDLHFRSSKKVCVASGFLQEVLKGLPSTPELQPVTAYLLNEFSTIGNLRGWLFSPVVPAGHQAILFTAWAECIPYLPYPQGLLEWRKSRGTSHFCVPAAPNAFRGGIEAGKDCTAMFEGGPPHRLQVAGKKSRFSRILAWALLRTDRHTLWVVQTLYAAWRYWRRCPSVRGRSFEEGYFLGWGDCRSVDCMIFYNMEVNRSLHNSHYVSFLHLPQDASLA